jgi:hypothetical protein
MLVSAAVCPHPPALVPAVSQHGADVLDGVRQASIRCCRQTYAVRHDLVVAVGTGPCTQRWTGGVAGNLRRFGVDAGFGIGAPELPLSLTVAAYLATEAGLDPPDVFQAVGADTPSDTCRQMGAALAGEADRVVMLVMGDGSAKVSDRSPGYVDSQAVPFNTLVARALVEGDAEALLRIEPGLADRLWVAGRPSWQVLAGALLGASPPLTGQALFDASPLGVGYFVTFLGARVDPRP